MRSRILALLTAAFTAVSIPASANTILLSGIVRDFLPKGTPLGTYNGHTGQGHDDFENDANLTGVDLNAVLTTLGADGKPVFDPDNILSIYVSTTTEANFDLWFNDTAGYNLSTPLQIALDDSGSPGTYSSATRRSFRSTTSSSATIRASPTTTDSRTKSARRSGTSPVRCSASTEMTTCGSSSMGGS